MKISTKFLSLPLLLTLLVLSGCANYNFHSELIKSNSSSLACQEVKPHLDVYDVGSEVITVGFNRSLKIIELVPEGNKKSDQAVKWSRLSYDETDTYAFLSKPETLKVKNIDKITNTQICITFNPKLFEDDDLGLEQYQALSGAECCGILSKKEIKKE